MKNQLASWRRFLTIATSSTLLKPQTVLAVVILSVLIHLLTSIDLGFEKILPRAGLAGVAVLPMFALIMLVSVLPFKKSRVGLTIFAILVGGIARGAIITAGLNDLDIQSQASSNFRIPAGAIISLVITLSIGYLLSTVYETQNALSRLRAENESLREVLLQLNEESKTQESNHVVYLLHYIRDQIQSISTTSQLIKVNSLEALMKGVVRPISNSWARSISEFKPTLEKSPEITLRGVWKSLNIVEHLPSPLYSTLIVIFLASSTWVAMFGRTIALQLIISVGPTLYVSLRFGYYIVRKYLRRQQSLSRDIALTLMLILLTTPAVIASIAVLQATDNPYALVLSGYVMVPLLTWVYMIANAALKQSDWIVKELVEIQHKLRWAIARRNLLSWYQEGVFSRLLHGPIQNSIQVGLLRMKSAKSESEISCILDEIINRIDEAIVQLSDENRVTRNESASITDIKKTWQQIASVDVTFPTDCQEQLAHDPAAQSIAVDLVQELLSNAIRHGRATQVNIQLEATGDTLVITCADNGAPYSNANNRAGLGTQFIDSCAIQFERTFDSSGNTFRLELPTSVSV